MDNNEWTVVVNRKKKINPNKNKPRKFICTWRGSPTKKDWTLFCYCCMSDLVSDVICRTFVSCGTCYCCGGDDPIYDDEEFVKNCIIRNCFFGHYNKDYHYTKNNEFYNNYN